ncbi:FG-GAP-like repeat-containing protein [Streptomyces sp. bgisy100]|uniref:FG-GAP-like repeat-containing protein n=1 Tax=Streptomyces sp. bgisy100 TaxID=3413783 RepID=UPI003D7527D2
MPRPVHHPQHRRTKPVLTALLSAPLAALTLSLLTAPAAQAASVSTWDKVAQCESGGNWSINTGNRYYGGLQFAKSTWDAFGGKRYASYPHNASKEQQIRIGEKVLATQGEGAWPDCGPRAGLGNDHADPYPAEPPTPQSEMANLTPVGDLTGDGKPDMLAVEVSTGDLYRYAGPGYGGSGARVKLGYGWNAMSDIVGTGDLTGDGVADIIALDKQSGDLYRYSGPHYNGRTKVRIGTKWDSMTNIAAVGDLTGDGKADIVAVEKSTGKLFRYSGPDFKGGSRVQIGTGWNAMSSVVGAGDLTGDGKADIVAVEKSTGNLYRYSGPDFSGATKVKIGTKWGSMINLTGVGDITGDKVPDLLAVEKSTGKLFRYSGPDFKGGSRVQIGTHW